MAYKRKKEKSTDQIQRENLRKMLNRVKTQVAKREETWLEFFEFLLPLCLPKEDSSEVFDSSHVVKAARLASEAVDLWEREFGKSE